MSGYFIHRPVDHSAPRPGEKYWMDEIEQLLGSTTLHGACTILECPKRFVLLELRKHMVKHCMTNGFVSQEMIPPQAKAG